MNQPASILKLQLADAAVALIDYGTPELVPGILALCAVFGVKVAPRRQVEIVLQVEAHQ